MIKQLIFAILMLSLVNVATAQEDEGPKGGTAEQRAEKQLAKLTKDLGLSNQQQPEVKDVILARIQKTDALRGTEEERKAKFQAAKGALDAYKASMKGILTPEQYTQFEQQQKEQRGKMREKMKNGKRKRSAG